MHLSPTGEVLPNNQHHKFTVFVTAFFTGLISSRRLGPGASVLADKIPWLRINFGEPIGNQSLLQGIRGFARQDWKNVWLPFSMTELQIRVLSKEFVGLPVIAGNTFSHLLTVNEGKFSKA